MDKHIFALKGQILHSKNQTELECVPDGYLVCDNGRVAGVYPHLPERYTDIPVTDHAGKLIIPGLVDLHLHAPQFAFCGLGMDLELLDWLQTHTFPEEAKYSDIAYAEKAYALFTKRMKAGGTTRAVVFATVHQPATLLLMDMLEKSGLVTMVGKVNMDRNANPELQETGAEESINTTRSWLQACKGRYQRTRPILTPRFVPSCTDQLMEMLGELQRETGLPVQSHLSENPGEVAWVRELCPEAKNYGDAYRQHGLFGGAGCPTIMAHCVYSNDEETALMAQQGVWVAHCPVSNACLSSGIAPVRRFLQQGVAVGLGTDVAGGCDPSVFGVMAQAVKDSKLRWRLVDDSLPPLTMAEAFYLATRGGGSFFGKVGAFEPGYEFDALVLDDSGLAGPFELTCAERLERLVYMGGDANVVEKYVQGAKLEQNPA